jgi:signal transduction histidine kinase
MKASTEDLITARHLAFVGRVTASLSHEVKNTLAIISESSGLMGDLLEYTAPPAEWAPYPRLKTLLTTIAEQVERSVVILKRLNRFAHSMDEQLVALDLNDLLMEIANLAQRFARLREVGLETRLCSESLKMRSDPFRIQQVVFHFIEVSLKFSPKNTTITVASRRDKGAAQVLITDEAPPRAGWLKKLISTPQLMLAETEEQSDPDLGVLGLIVAKLDWSIEAEDLHPQGNRVIVTFPLENG